MTDITITRDNEQKVAAVWALTDAGIEFVDAWYPTRQGANVEVVDSGRLVVEFADVDGLITAARTGGLAVEVGEWTEGPV